ncbi:hypothetical protein MSR1_02900 [Magnetospirillum gryphiswaldense MSR-1]|uniref:Uncharacterized protein n=1 Tax=Magnetospirillum gryphiswaldense TaxID=55518 RepID=A4U519_9PROT|nr:hypothetical protein MSR1_02900 [Magnetospirillum gryphiswaldense MSR-1]AVM76707.1 hypothetical protein MSR1L_02900 [Magnetospirillum gryphiswaldense]CAM77976.1 hypothetical protein MGR_4044 [Magnetospirillum gryphiswaldense MSR-1]
MPLTIPPIPNAAPFAAFSDNVGIFSNSKAREIPTRLNAIAQALKDHINTLWLKLSPMWSRNRPARPRLCARR